MLSGDGHERGDDVPDFSGGPVEGDLDVLWIHGSRATGSRTDPPLQVHRHDKHTFILRQSKDVTFEAPFLFLLFGNDRALLLDTGATTDPTAFPLRETVDDLVSAWLREHPRGDHPRTDYELVVAHSHAHGDHIAGDAQFADRPHTTVVGTQLAQVQAFFGFTQWPEQVVTCDLGGRVLELTGVPGHHPTSVAVLDPWTGFLLTGDTVYPGRLYGFDMPAFVASLERLVECAETRSVTYVLGCHIEMSRVPGRDYPMGARYQPDEPQLQMTMDQLRAVRDAARATAGRPGIFRHDDFIVVSGMGPRTVVPLLLRSWRHRLGERLRARR